LAPETRVDPGEELDPNAPVPAAVDEDKPADGTPPAEKKPGEEPEEKPEETPEDPPKESGSGSGDGR
jgi:hypothetical protein